MGAFVLVHGSWHGGWCWAEVAPLLEAAGHRVLAPDLRGLGAETIPAAEVTLQTWVDQIGDLLRGQPEPVVLVGHSRAGIVVSEVAEAMPDAVAALVYLCAFLPQDGESLIQLAQSDRQGQILPHVAVDEERGCHTLDQDAARDLLYGQSPVAAAERAVARLRPEPNAPTFTPVRLTEERFGRVPRFYIRCANDRVISPELQDRMAAASPCRRVFTLAADHSPWLSAPGELADLLATIVAREEASTRNRLATAG